MSEEMKESWICFGMINGVNCPVYDKNIDQLYDFNN